MDYCLQILGKSIGDLTFTDLENFFLSAKEESELIEFKSYNSTYGDINRNLEGVIRSVSAFLNSSGGVVIWGAPTGVVQGNGIKKFEGPLTPLPDFREKDWFINKISDSITPLPIGIVCQALESQSSYIYLFEIQVSNYRPHQYKSIYYARLDGQTKPAPHYLIEALFKRVSYPNIEGHIGFEKIYLNGSLYCLDISIFMFNFSELQNEHDVSYMLLCSPGYFLNSRKPANGIIYRMEGGQMFHKGLIDVLSFGGPDSHRETIVIDPRILPQRDYKLKLVLSFGGKSSPLKITHYELDLRNIDWASPEYPNYLIVEKFENELMSERQQKLGTNREENLRELLRR